MEAIIHSTLLTLNPFLFPFFSILIHSTPPPIPTLSNKHIIDINRMNIQIQYIECPIQYSAFEFACDSADSPSPDAPARAESEAATPSQTEDSAENKPTPQSLTISQLHPSSLTPGIIRSIYL